VLLENRNPRDCGGLHTGSDDGQNNEYIHYFAAGGLNFL
jgi:hypothetical protein